MKKLGHKYFAIATLPFAFIKFGVIENEYINKIKPLNEIISNQNDIFNSLSNISYNSLLIIPAVFLYFAGVRVPDLDMKLRVFFKKEERSLLYLYHRQFTHSLFLYLSMFLLLLYYTNNPLAVLPLFFLYGIFSHLIADMLTGSVPWGLYGHYGKRISRFGITTFLPNFMHTIFTRTFVAFIEKNYRILYVLFVLNIGIVYYLNWM